MNTRSQTDERVARECAMHRNYGAALYLAQRVSELNPDAAEIGEGMLRQLVNTAQHILQEYNELTGERVEP